MKKYFVIFTFLLSLSLQNAQETKKIDRFDSIPLEYQTKVENGGTIELISYPTKDYYGEFRIDLVDLIYSTQVNLEEYLN